MNRRRRSGPIISWSWHDLLSIPIPNPEFLKLNPGCRNFKTKFRSWVPRFQRAAVITYKVQELLNNVTLAVYVNFCTVEQWSYKGLFQKIRFWYNLLNSHAVAVVRCGTLLFNEFFRPFSMTKSSRDKIVIPFLYIFTTFIFFKVFQFHLIGLRKKSQVLKILNDGESLWNLYDMLNKLFIIIY